MTYHVVMPQLGMTMTEGAVARWLKQPGDAVTKGEPLFEVQTDKVEMEVEAPCSGVLAEILIPPEQFVPVGSTIAILSDADATNAPSSTALPVTPPATPAEVATVTPLDGATVTPAEGASATPASSAKVVAPAPAPVPSAEAIAGDGAEPRPERRISPRARRVADEEAVDLRALIDFKPRGRIVEADVRAFLATRRASANASTSTSPSTRTRPAGAASPDARFRQAVARRMEESREVPHFYLSALVDASELSALRGRLLPLVEARSSVRLSYLDFFIRAAALALVECPDVNASWDGAAVVRHPDIHVAFAAQFGDRLLTPVVRHAATRGLAQTARQRAALVEQGRSGKLSAGEIEGGTFSISNLGPHGVDQFQAIVVPPQSAILAVGRLAPRPFAIDGRLEIRDSVWLTLSVDHRVLDGAAAARFLGAIVARLTSPFRLLLAEA